MCGVQHNLKRETTETNNKPSAEKEMMLAKNVLDTDWLATTKYVACRNMCKCMVAVA